MFFRYYRLPSGLYAGRSRIRYRHRPIFLPTGRVVVLQRDRGETLIKNSQRGKGLPVCARRLLESLILKRLPAIQTVYL